MKKIIVIPNPTRDGGLAVTHKIISMLNTLGISAYVDASFEIVADGLTYYTELPSDADMIIVVGGDGSVIDASAVAIKLDIPLLGVNLGKVGYLSELEPDALPTLSRLVSGEYTVESKMLLCAELVSESGEILRSEHLAVNDVVISQDRDLGIAAFCVRNGRGEEVNYRANGVILATPVGSTAYSLSAGGPVIAHNLNSITVTPVCPHSFFNRSIVYEPDERITVINTGETPLNVSLDGRGFAVIKRGESCRTYRSLHNLKMITFSESNMFATLFRKIKFFENQY
ncbi:MAG: NAD(+)/NADH kinase [Clostridia bacterium]|nr:NAD(+)/NADH kinase [Clostridia bacterium]